MGESRRNVFISHSGSGGLGLKLVSELVDKLKAEGIAAAWTDPSQDRPGGGTTFSYLDDMINSADYVLVFVDSMEPKTSTQDGEWRASLEAAWSDPKKRLIPVLVGDVGVPNFIRSSLAPGQSIEAVRVQDPKRDWNDVADKLVRVFQEKTDLGTVAQSVNSTQEDRARQHERLEYLKSTARTFKPS
jgi:hypothetical protein